MNENVWVFVARKVYKRRKYSISVNELNQVIREARDEIKSDYIKLYISIRRRLMFVMDEKGKATKYQIAVEGKNAKYIL